MRRFIPIGVLGIGLLLGACGQPEAITPAPTAPAAQGATAATLPATVAPPTASPLPAATSVPTSAPTGAPASATPAQATATAGATATRGATARPASPTAPAATAPANRVTDTPLVVAPQLPSPDQIGALAERSLEALAEAGAPNLSVQSVDAQEWSDSSLGCPDPAALYLAVITPGYLVTLSDGTNAYAVHTNIDGSLLVWCRNNLPVPVPPVPAAQ